MGGSNFSSQSATDSDADPAIQHDFARRSSPEGSRPQKALQNSKSKKSENSKKSKKNKKNKKTQKPPPTKVRSFRNLPGQSVGGLFGFFGFLDFEFWSACWGRDPSGELRLAKSRWMAGSASESVTLCEENLGSELTFHTPICFGRLS